MKIGCCSNMLCREPAAGGLTGSGDALPPCRETESIRRLARTGIQYAGRIAHVGFDYIELPLAQVMELTGSEFETLRQQLRESGLPCLACNNFFPVTLRLTGPDVDDERIDKYVARAVRRAKKLGASRVVFGSGPAKRVPEGFPRDAAWRQLVHLLLRIAPVARASGVTIAIEPLRRQECNIINTYEEGCRLARDVDDPNIRVLVDAYHLGEEREPAGHLIDNADLLAHVHTARLAGRGYPTAFDNPLNRAFYSALKTIRYTGGISLEAYTDNFDQEAPKALAFLRAATERKRG